MVAEKTYRLEPLVLEQTYWLELVANLLVWVEVSPLLLEE
jgi:hypothetical protein